MEGSSLQQTTVARLVVFLILLQGRPSQCQLKSPPKLTQQPSQPVYYFSDEHRSVVLPCQANGTPPLNYRWEHNGMTTNGTGTLSIEPANEDDVGNYTCFVSNTHGTAVSNTVEVKFAYLERFNDTQSVPDIDSSTSRMVLRCNPPSGYPSPQIHWTEGDGTPLFDNGSSWNPARSLVQDQAGNLVFLNRSMDNNGTYVCKARCPAFPRDLHFSEDKEVAVEKVTGGIPPSPPEILESPRDVEACRGEDVKMYCLAVGNPIPTVTWTRHLDPAFRAEGPVLSLSNVQLEDAGAYNCTASSESGSNNETRMLHVQAAPYWIVKPSDTTVYEGDIARFSCQAGGEPSPHLVWMENGDHNPQCDGSKLVQVNSVTEEDMKVYQCMASNVHGQIIANAILNVTEEPLVTPSGFRYAIHRDDGRNVRALISWKKINHRHLQKITIKYKRKDGQHQPSKKDCHKSNPCTILGLKEDRFYVLKVTAVYSEGQRESAPVTIKASLQKRPAAPSTGGPKLWKLITGASTFVLILGVSVPLVMCIVLCIRDQVNGPDPDDELPTESDAWGPGKPKPKVEKAKTVRPVRRNDDAEQPNNN